MWCMSLCVLMFAVFPARTGGVEAAKPAETAKAVQKVELYRFSDRVTVVKGGGGKETPLFYNNKVTLLDERDVVRQGSGAVSECRFQDGGKIRFFARACWRVGEQNDERHVILVEEFTRMLVKAKGEVVLLLPGGTRLSTRFGECFLERTDNRIEVRNQGAYDVHLAGYLVTGECRVLPGGHTVSIPLYDAGLEEEGTPVTVREVNGMIVKITGGYRLEERPGLLVLSRPLGKKKGSAWLGGARVVLEPGESVIFRLP